MALVAAAAVLLTVWDNTAHGGAPLSSTMIPSLDWTASGAQLSSAELTTTVTALDTARYAFDCTAIEHASIILWLDDHLLCGTEALFAPGPGSAAPFPPWVELAAGEPHFLRLRTVHNATSAAPASLSLRWSKSGGALVPLPGAVLSPPARAPAASARVERAELQRTLATGWGSWFRPSALAATLLPEAATLTVGICHLSAHTCLDPSAIFTPEQDRGQEEPKADATARPGLHAYDRSYWALYVQYHGANVSLEWSGTHAGAGANATQELDLVATLIGASAAPSSSSSSSSSTGESGSATFNASDYALLVSPSFVWNRAGAVALASGGGAMSWSAVGLRDVTARALTPTLPSGVANGSSPYAPPGQSVFFAMPFVDGGKGGGAAAVLSTDPSASLSAAAVTKRVSAARATTVAQYSPAIAAKSDLAEAALAMSSCLMWNVIFHPTQLGPFVSVSRSFTQQPYEIFEWDTYFGATMLSSAPEGLAIALSSLIQVTKTKTVGPRLDLRGFVPGYSKGGRWLSEDRTERPIGAMTALRIYNRWHGKGGRNLTWVLELIYDDLIDWHEWLWAKRLLPPLNLAVPGSNDCVVPPSAERAKGAEGGEAQTVWCKKSWGMGELQGARFESLDNSPM